MTSTSPPGSLISRRNALQAAACGFGWLALAGMQVRSSAVAAPGGDGREPGLPHFPARAKRVIFLFMQGGPSQVDTFDPKPALDRHDGTRMPFDDPRTVANTGKTGTDQRVLRSPWRFTRYGQSGLWVSDLFPHVAGQADRLCVLRSMQTEGVAHGPATLFLHCGASQVVRPSLGSWLSYGLGSESDNLPAFVTLAPSMGNGGARNFGNAFLPARHQGLPVGIAGQPARELTLRNLGDPARSPEARRRQFGFLRELQQEQRRRRPGDAGIEAVIQSHELAWRMQSHVPGLLDLSRETPETLALYGIGESATDDYGRQCLMARRLCEAGVRFVQVTYGDNTANPRWDQHSDLPKHAVHARAVDKPVAGLLQDLHRRGLLEDTLVWWGGEFGRTPYAEKDGTGRDHNPGAFTVWLAGAGVRAGHVHGATDDFGHRAVERPVPMHDLHATLLHLLGLDHERLVYRYDGRDFRLTDVHGVVVREILS